jgi:uncharacterized protein (DUF2164 family)
MPLPLSKEQKAEAIQSIRRFAAEKLELQLSELQAESLLDYFFREIGPFAFNEGVQEAQKFLLRFGEALPGTCFREPLTYWEESGSKVVRRKPQG